MSVKTSRGRQTAQQRDRLRKKIASKHGPKKICLTMIVKNESKNMDRLLNSVKSIIDMISIVDTGSTDNTEDVIVSWGKANKIPTTVHHEPFKNFSYNRTHSAKAAQQTYPEADFLLLSDADFVWEKDCNGKFDKTLLIDHKYLIEQHHGQLTYWNIRMLNAKVDWVCRGRTHEFWAEAKNQTTYCGEVRTGKIHTLSIDDKEDGGCKTDKFERDERLLREGLDDPEEEADLKTRYKFYLGQTLKDRGKHEESIEFYKARAVDGGWAEEVYYSKFQIGFNHEQVAWRYKHILHLLTKDETELTDTDKEYLAKHNSDNKEPSDLLELVNHNINEATLWYKNAHNYRKVRTESMVALLRMYRMLGEYEKVMENAVKLKNIKFPTEDSLFIDRSCYTYQVDFEVSIAAFYVEGKKDLGRQAISRLLERDDLPSNMRSLVENNSRHYI